MKLRNNLGQFLKTEKGICKVKNCENTIRSLGYCNRHHLQIRRHGKILERTQQDPNKFVIEGDICKIKLYDRNGNYKDIAIVDLEDYNKVKDHKWRLLSNGYVCSSSGLLSRVIMGISEGIVDHRDFDPLNNRRINLRLCTRHENTCYQRKRSDNTSGFKGVSFNKKCKKYEAYVNNKNKRFYLGLFATKEEASHERDRVALKLHKEFHFQKDTNGSISEYSK